MKSLSYATGRLSLVLFCLFIILPTGNNLYSVPSPVNSVMVSKFTQGLDMADPYAAQMFRQCFPHTLETTIELMSDNTTYIITGDINAMWIRDSSAQIHPYIYICKNDNDLKNVIRGTIRRHMKHFNTDNPLINSRTSSYGVHEYKYEIDNIPYVIRLCWTYWKITGETFWTNNPGYADFSAHQAFNKAIEKLKEEQTNVSHLPYTGMIWCTHRPSDDECAFHYLIPSNMFTAAWLPKLKEMYTNFWPSDTQHIDLCQSLHDDITNGIAVYGKYNHSVYGDIWAYEVDGYGQYNLMDDANVPSLLSAPYLGFCSNNDPVYQNTRNFLTSSDNPYYFSGSFCAGIGSPHTGNNRVWPMAVIIQALTSDNHQEIKTMLEYLTIMEAGKRYMHEGVDPDNPGNYSRDWFTWPDSLYSELILTKILGLGFYPDDGVYIKPLLNKKIPYACITNGVTFGDRSVIRIISTGTNGNITSATENGGAATIDPVKGVKITSDPASLIVKTKSDLRTSQKIDLSALFNRDAISWDPNRSDSTGDASLDAWYLDSDDDTLFSSHDGMRFKMGSRDDGENNIISCDGRTVKLYNMKATNIHLFGWGESGDQAGTFRINYSDGNFYEFTKTFSDWCSDQPKYSSEGEASALVMGHRQHKVYSDEVKKCHIFEYVIPVAYTKTLTNMILPDNSDLRIAAITLGRIVSTNQGQSTPQIPPSGKTPKFVMGISLSRSEQQSTLIWLEVNKNSDNSAIDTNCEISYYQIYGSESLENWVKISNTTNTALTFDTPSFDETSGYYYKINAVNIDGKESRDYAYIHSSGKIMVPLVNPSTGDYLLKIVLPYDAFKALLKENSGLNDDLWISIESVAGEDVFYGYEIKLLKYSDDTLVENLEFQEALDVSLYYDINFISSSLDAPDIDISSRNIDQYLKVFTHNGIEWEALGSIVDALNNRISFIITKPGKFAVMIKQRSPELELIQLVPMKIFTPHGDAPHNEMRFYFENPEGEKLSCAIFSLKGAKVRELPVAMSTYTEGYFYWDGKDEGGKICNGGIYIYQIESDHRTINGTVILAK